MVEKTEKERAIDDLRFACGTLPSREIKEKTEIHFGCSKLQVEYVDGPENPYKAIFAMATATWGDEDYKTKWNKVSPLGRFIVVLNTLRGKSLPTALESPKFTFIVRGLPRHCFDQFARTRIGAGYGSIGCRDNSKMDTSFILYSEYKNIPKDLLNKVIKHLKETKGIYKEIMELGQSSWQMARSILEMSYHHPFVFTQNLLSLMGQCRRRMCFGEEEFISGLHWKIREFFMFKGMGLIANYMRPACDFAGRCLYSKEDGSEMFGNLFSGCGRWKAESNYSEFNKSCTDSVELGKQLGFKIPSPEDYKYLSPDEESYDLLSYKDKQLFSQE